MMKSLLLFALMAVIGLTEGDTIDPYPHSVDDALHAKDWLICRDNKDTHIYYVSPGSTLGVIRNMDYSEGGKVTGDLIGFILLDTDHKAHYVYPNNKDNDKCAWVSKPVEG